MYLTIEMSHFEMVALKLVKKLWQLYDSYKKVVCLIGFETTVTLKGVYEHCFCRLFRYEQKRINFDATKCIFLQLDIEISYLRQALT